MTTIVNSVGLTTPHLSPRAKVLLQKHYEERNGDDLTKAIKVARHNFRKRRWEELQ